MTKVYGATGVKGIDVTTERGTVKYDADKSGFINIENPSHVKQAVAEGMVIASSAAGFKTDGYPCTGCGHNSVFKFYTCPKCATENDFRKAS